MLLWSCQLQEMDELGQYTDTEIDELGQYTDTQIDELGQYTDTQTELVKNRYTNLKRKTSSKS